MIDSPRERDPVELLADEFASRRRAGESPSISEYAAAYPQYAEQIEEVFPGVVMMEQLQAAERAKRHAVARHGGSAHVPEQLGDFRIIREVGRGGMGIVYEAEQQSLGRRVAVKVLPKHALLLDKHLKRFRREAQTAAKLHHTNIVPVFGVGEQDGLHYYVMPLVRGVGLDEVIRESRRAAEEPRADHWHVVADVGVQAAEALSYAHSQGTLHRDIKPSNLLVDESGLVCVADFGLARAVDHADASRSDEVVGTLRYMAPEQFQGKADARSDVYALGLTLYELAVLQPAFEDTDRRRSLQGRQPEPEPVRPRKINAAVPRDLETIILKCLAQEPSKRYPTASALAKDLRRFLEDRPIHARPVSSLEQAWRWCRRNPALASTSALAVLLLLAVGVTALAGHLQTRKAYAGTRAALGRAEATSQLALDVLDDIYLQLSPDRIWILSDADAAGEACACLGLRSSASLLPSADRVAMQLQASEETASLLKGLLAFYDRLAEQGSNDSEVVLQSAIAGRRVGDIRQRLGQLDDAEEEYERAIRKLSVLAANPSAGAKLRSELARTHNELGNVRSARFESSAAYASHRKAFAILQSVDPAYERPAEYRYETARTLYFLANKHTVELRNRRGREPAEQAAGPGPRYYNSRACRTAAIGILEQLARENPNIPDYRFLLALCHRPSGVEPTAAGGPAGAQGRQRAIRILDELRTQYPQVPDYRYELAATYAWIHTGLYPWESRSAVASDAEQSLLKALDELQWLLAHNPRIPHYARSKTLILAKLGSVCRGTQRLAEAEAYFRRSLETQQGVVVEFPDLPYDNWVLVEFLRLRLAQVCRERSTAAHDVSALSRSRDLLDTCIENLTELTTRPELATDRLAWHSLPLAYETLGQALGGLGETDKAEEAVRTGKTIKAGHPDDPKLRWQL